jgi:hypothetical protein
MAIADKQTNPQKYASQVVAGLIQDDVVLQAEQRRREQEAAVRRQETERWLERLDERRG